MHLKNIFNLRGNPPLPKCCSSSGGPASVSRDSLAELARDAQVPGEDSAILVTFTGSQGGELDSLHFVSSFLLSIRRQLQV